MRIFFWITALALLVYILELRDEIYQQLSNQIGYWYDRAVWLYPRIKSESYRFSPDFLLNRLDIAIAKSVLLVWMIAILKLYKRQLLVLIAKQNLSPFAVVLFYAQALFYTADSYRLLSKLKEVEVFFEPISFYSAMPDSNMLLLISISLVVSGLMVIFGVFRFWAAVVFAMAFVFQEGLFFCFGKTNHQYAPTMYGLLVMPAYFLLPNRLTIFILKIAVSLPYSLAGLEKIFSSPVYWLSSPGLAAVLVWQISYVVGVFRYKYLYHGFGLLFHAAVAFQMGIGFYVHPWQSGYVFFYERTDLKKSNFLFNKVIAFFTKLDRVKI